MHYCTSTQKDKLHRTHLGQQPGSEMFHNVPFVAKLQYQMPQQMMEQYQPSHYPLDEQYSNLNEPYVPAPMSLCSSDSQSYTLHTDVACWQNRAITQQSLTRLPTLEDEIVYRCNFVTQLKGLYETQTEAGPVQITVTLPKVAATEEQYAIAKRVSSDGDVFDDQFIYMKPFNFVLCSVNGEAEAVMRRGINMKHLITWENSLDGTQAVWHRKGKVTFDLIKIESVAHPNFISGFSTVSSTTITNDLENCDESASMAANQNSLNIKEEKCPKAKLVDIPAYSSGNGCSLSSAKLNSSQFIYDVLSGQINISQDNIFEVIKAHCIKNPSLLDMVVEWGMNNAARKVSLESMNKLSQGRLWVTARANNPDEGYVYKEVLDDIKGAYQDVGGGIYQQPDPMACGSEKQYRLLKDNKGFWMIQLNEEGTGSWTLRAKQLADGSWVDLKNNRSLIRVQLIPLIMILKRLGEDVFRRNRDLNKRLDFLFTACDQRKLHGKLKVRNLRHNIISLMGKIEKRYGLSFGLQVASIARSIMEEHEDCP